MQTRDHAKEGRGEGKSALSLYQARIVQTSCSEQQWTNCGVCIILHIQIVGGGGGGGGVGRAILGTGYRCRGRAVKLSQSSSSSAQSAAHRSVAGGTQTRAHVTRDTPHTQQAAESKYGH